jgi:hypothetical protein
MEIKGLNQITGLKTHLIQSSEVLNAIELLCPDLIKHPELLRVIDKYIFDNQFNEEQLVKIFTANFDNLSFDSIENLIITLTGFKIVSNENNFKNHKELDQYFQHQVAQLEIIDDKEKITLHYRNGLKD